MKHYLLFGPPGAGKGTQAKLLADKYNLRHVSTGELLRREIANKSESGLAAKALIDAGNLVDDSIVEKMIENEINGNPAAPGFLFDGFPRTVAQAKALDALLEKRGEAVEKVISIIIDDALVYERIAHRAAVEKRKDDSNPDIIENRIKTYHLMTEPLVSYYKEKGKYFEIEGDGSIEEIFNRISALI